MTQASPPDHGGGIDAAAARFGGARQDWLDLSTGINPIPYQVPGLTPRDWATLPDQAAYDRLIRAARGFWRVPGAAGVLAAPGASSLIAALPGVLTRGRVRIDTPTYNEHEAAFRAHGWQVTPTDADLRVVVHPNNPTGQFWDGTGPAPLTIVDESFCDVAPARSVIDRAGRGLVVLKSFGKFWGLAGLRLGFVIGDNDLLNRLAQRLGPWAVSGPALSIGARALEDTAWAETTRLRLARDAQRLDRLCTDAGMKVVGGTDLFRLYDTPDAKALRDRLAQHLIWSRAFPYSTRWLRLGLPGDDTGWARLAAALAPA